MRVKSTDRSNGIETFEPMILMSATTIEGTDASEWINGDDNDNLILALGGDDEIYAPIGDNDIDGGDGNDTLVIYSGDQADFDVTRLADGRIQVIGPALNGGDNTNVLDNVERILFIDGALDTDTISGSDDPPDDDPPDDDPPDDDPPTDDPPNPNATIVGTNAADWISGTEGDDVVDALAGNDEIHNPFGNNIIDGGAGQDTLIIYEGVQAGYQIVTLADGSVQVTGPGMNGATVVNTLRNVERITFNDGAITLSDTPPDDPPTDDPPPSTLNGQTLFHRDGHLYMLTSAQGSWTDGQAEASQYGGNLVAINDAAEEAWLQQTFGGGDYWIGITDAASEGSFTWASGEQVAFTNWASGQPDNAGGNQDYAVLNIGTGTSWEDRGNSDAPILGIIEIGISGTIDDAPGDDIVPNGAGFTTETITTGLVQPIAFAEADDGTIFVAEKAGRVQVVQNGQVAGTMIDLRDVVDSVQDRGLLGIALDPNFAQNGYVYLNYVVDLTPGDDAVTTPAMGQLVRVTAAADAGEGYVASEDSMVVVLDGHDMFNANHAVGDVDFDADGNIVFTWGDGGFNNELRLATQDLDSPQGKLFRVDPVTFEGVPDNPFYDANDPDSLASKVLALGIRNSWKFAIDDVTGDIYLGEVTDEGPEEINIVRADGSSNPNLGWPYYEGDNPTIHAVPPADFTYESPFIEIPHGNADDDAVLGGDIYRGDAYPDVYDGRYFFANFGFAQGRIYTADASGNYQQFGQTGDYVGLTDMQQGSDGHIWIMSIVSGDIRRLVFDGDDVQANRDPEASVAASSTAGVGPLDVDLTGAASTDADGDSLLLAWDFESDGIIDAIEETVSNVYENTGRLEATLVVSDGRGGTDTAIAEIDVLATDPADGNLALGRPATQSGVLNDGLASRAVDGNTSGNYADGSVSQTNQVRTPFWQTDLGQSFNLGEIELSNRTDGSLGDRLNDFWILVSDSPFNSANLDAVRADPNVTATHFNGTAGNVESISLNAAGRYVRIQLAGTDDILSLAEVRVFEA